MLSVRPQLFGHRLVQKEVQFHNSVGDVRNQILVPNISESDQIIVWCAIQGDEEAKKGHQI